eukprot:6348190-Lingulodinium_polyedra.AAC.1
MDRFQVDALADWSFRPGRRVQLRHGRPDAADSHLRNFIHCCCEPLSSLSRRFSASMQVLDVTEEVDFTRTKT